MQDNSYMVLILKTRIVVKKKDFFLVFVIIGVLNKERTMLMHLNDCFQLNWLEFHVYKSIIKLINYDMTKTATMLIVAYKNF